MAKIINDISAQCHSGGIQKSQENQDEEVMSKILPRKNKNWKFDILEIKYLSRVNSLFSYLWVRK
jgi:hypothetical protein